MIHTYTRNNIYRKDHERWIKVHQKQITNNSMGVSVTKTFISGQDQPDN